MLVALDGHAAGDTERDTVVTYLREPGVDAHPKPAGMEVTDILVSHQAEAGCACATCGAWRAAA